MRRFWSKTDLARLKRLYPVRPTPQVARVLGRTVFAVYGAAHKLGLSRPPYRPQSIPGGEAYRFPKGHVPANKGLRRPGWHAGRMRETQFKKGCRSGMAAENWVPVGTILADFDGYLHIKVRDAVHGKEHTGMGNTSVWPMYNRYLWEQAHGPIPAKHVVVFKDRDRGNCVLENLELISMGENARRNSMWARLPRELALAIQMNGVLKRKIRGLSGKEQNGRSA